MLLGGARASGFAQVLVNRLTRVSGIIVGRLKAMLWRPVPDGGNIVPRDYWPDEEMAFERRGSVPQQLSMEIQPRLNVFKSLGPHGFHRIAYTEWGDPASSHLVICTHGFTRNSRDFDVLAARLSDRCRVICMDVVGRGTSDWLQDKQDYDFSLYLSDAAALLARVMTKPATTRKDDSALRVDWIGTSMGGLIGMMLAAKANTPITRLVLNDVGPMVPWSALSRLKNVHSRLRGPFKSLDEIETCLRRICDPFGPIAEEHWRHVVQHSSYRLDNGDYVLAYDPGVMSSMRHARNGNIEFGVVFSGIDLWPIWDRVKCPTLVVRGEESDLLLGSTCQQMRLRGPKARVAEFPGVGHAPWLMAEDQINVVRDFLLEARAPQ